MLEIKLRFRHINIFTQIIWGCLSTLSFYNSKWKANQCRENDQLCNFTSNVSMFMPSLADGIGLLLDHVLLLVEVAIKHGHEVARILYLEVDCHAMEAQHKHKPATPVTTLPCLSFQIWIWCKICIFIPHAHTLLHTINVICCFCAKKIGDTGTFVY